MTGSGDPQSFGPYAFTLTPAEIDAAAARSSLRGALRGALTASRLALTLFALLLLFAFILALTDLISRRVAGVTVLAAAAAYMIQRLATHWRIFHRVRNLRRIAIASLEADGAVTARIDERSVALEGSGRLRRLEYVDCEEAEDAGGLIYLWPRDGVPIVLPARVLGNGEAGRLVAQIKKRISGERAP